VVSKAGQSRPGLGRFSSSLGGRAIPGVSFLAETLIDGERRRAYPWPVEQRLPSDASARVAPSRLPKRRRGRPPRRPELRRRQQMLRAVSARMAPLGVGPVVLDGFFGTSPAPYRVPQRGVPRISQWGHTGALYLPYPGAKPAPGPTPR